MKISFVIPSRNNLKYLQQAVQSIHDCYGTYHDIVLLDDASTDGTWEWIQSLEGEHVIKYRNEGPERQGHTILYDKGIDLSRTEIFTIFHADMITTTNHIPNLLKHLNTGVVVSATRVEPPLHPPGPEKHVRAFGFEPEEFKKDDLLQFVEQQEPLDSGRVSNGIFAPWCMYKKDFLAIQGHDKLFAPMELEDSDIFNRMHLAGYKLVQSRDSFVYHMTCRGSRFKDGIEIEAEIPLADGTIWYKPKDSEEYKALRAVKFREWWRKWSSNVLHDEHLMPIVPHKYNIAFVVQNATLQAVEFLEPWCDRLYIDDDMGVIQSHYIDKEQKNTLFDLSKKVLNKSYNHAEEENDIVVYFDLMRLSQQSFEIIQQLSQIIEQSNEIGDFEIDIFKIKVTSLKTYEHEYIRNDSEYYLNKLLKI
jgi:glycosyltransferase involved in cell wall biosynthesis